MSKRDKFEEDTNFEKYNGERREEYGKTLYRDMFVVAVLLVLISDFLVLLWNTFRRDPTEGFHLIGAIFGKFIESAWETWAVGGILLVAFVGIVLIAEKIAFVTDKIFDYIVKSKIMVFIIRIGLIGLVGGWLYFIFT